MASMPTATPIASTGPRLLVEFSSATDSVSSATMTVAAAGDDRRARAAQRLGHRRVAAVVAAQFLPVTRDDQQRVIGAGAEHQHLQDAGALRVDRQASVRREQVDHRLGGDQRHPGRDHRQQPQHRAPVGDQQDHDDDRQRRVQQRAVDALEHLVAVGRVPERAGDVRGQAVRVRAGDRADGSRRPSPRRSSPCVPRLTWRMVWRALPSADGIGPITWPAHDAVESRRSFRASAAALARSAAVRPEARSIDDDPGEDVGRLEA